MRALVVEDEPKMAAPRPARLAERPTVLQAGSLGLDPATRQVLCGDTPVELSAKEFALLETFLRRPGQALSRLRSTALRAAVDRHGPRRRLPAPRRQWRVSAMGRLASLPIRLRRTLAFVAAMAVVLVSARLFLYLRLGAALDRTIDRSLLGRADDVTALVRAAGSGLRRAPAAGACPSPKATTRSSSSGPPSTPCWTVWRRRWPGNDASSSDASHELRTPLAALRTELELVADRLRAEQALGKLVDSALRYGHGQVQLAALRGNRGVEFHVRGRGPGFPPEFMDLAFDRFTRADPSRHGPGAGPGLAIVKVIAHAHPRDRPDR